MSLFDKIFKKFGYSKKSISSIYPNPEFNLSADIGQGAPDHYENYLGQYADAPWVFACVRRIATKGAGVPFKIKKKVRKDGGTGYELVNEHELLSLLNRVNPFMTGEDLLEATLSYLELTGNCYWLLDMVKRGKPTEIYTLCPSRVKIVTDKTDKVKYYEYYISEIESKKFLPEEIVHFKYFNSLDENYGLSPLSAGRMAVQSHALGDAYNKRFFENSAEPRGMLVAKNPLSTEQKKQITHMWRMMHQGLKNAHRSGLLDGDLEWKPMGLSQKDMEFINSKRMTREDIMGVFGVPPVMVGVFEYANYANSKEQREIFWKDTMVPKLLKIAGTINEFLIKKYGEDLKVCFDFDAIEELREDEKYRAETDKILIESGIRTINEIRAERGLVPVEGGDTVLKPISLVSIDHVSPTNLPASNNLPPDDDPPTKETPPPEPAPEPPVTKQDVVSEDKAPDIIDAEIEALSAEVQVEDVKAEPEISAEEKKRIARKEFRDKKWGVYKDLTEDLEKKWYKPLASFFNSQQKTVLSNLEKVGWKSFCQDVRFKNTKQTDSEINRIIFNISDENKEAKKLSTPRIEEAVSAQADAEIAELGLDIAFDLENPEVAKWIDKKSFKFADDVNTTTQESLRKTLKEAVKEGEGIDKVQDRVAEVFDIAKGPRTESIARTEVISASNQGAAEVYKQSDVITHKEWISTRDGKVRDEHLIDGEVVKKGAEFSNGLNNPGDPAGEPGNIINCRCTMAGLTEEDV